MATEIKRMTAAEARDLGIIITKVRKPHGLGQDGAKNAQALLTQYVGETVVALNKIMRLASGKVSRTNPGDETGQDYPVVVSEAKRQWAEDKIATMHSVVFEALSSGVRPTTVLDGCPAG